MVFLSSPQLGGFTHCHETHLSVVELGVFFSDTTSCTWRRMNSTDGLPDQPRNYEEFRNAAAQPRLLFWPETAPGGEFGEGLRRDGLIDGFSEFGVGKGFAHILVEPLPEELLAISGHGKGCEGNGGDLPHVLSITDHVEKFYAAVFGSEVDVQKEEVKRLTLHSVQRLFHIRRKGDLVGALKGMLQEESRVRIVFDGQDTGSF